MNRDMVRAAAQFAAYTVLIFAPVLGIHALAYALVPGPSPSRTTISCPTEDSTNCVWHADTQGNGEGRSFIDVEGKQLFISGRKG